MVTRFVTILLTTLIFAAHLYAAVDHSEFISGSFASGEEATRQCLQCHEDEARQIMQTTHWSWSVDWNLAAENGMKASGLPYSGEYGFAPTIMYWRINHMVAPKEQAVGCLECHGDNGRLDWKALGYDDDPIATRQTVRTLRQ